MYTAYDIISPESHMYLPSTLTAQLLQRLLRTPFELVDRQLPRQIVVDE